MNLKNISLTKTMPKLDENTFNIYCDESRVENRDSNNMVIGALFMPRKYKNKIVKDIKNIFSKHNFNYELKWSKVHKGFIPFYKEIIDYFTSNNNLNYRCIIVDKSKIDLKRYHSNDSELAFFKFYYLMLRPKLLSQNKYYIFLDKKPTRDRNRARALRAFLDLYVLLHKRDCGISHFQAYNSKNNLLIQLSDFLTGLVGFDINKKEKKSAKAEIAAYLKLKIGKDNFLLSSPLSEEKFNNFIWDSNYEKS